MGFYDDQIVPRIVHFALGTEPRMELRRKALAAARGDVLEFGFGSGLNLSCYPKGVTRLKAVEPSEVGRKMAAKAIAHAPFPVELVGLDGQHLPLESASVDCAVATWTLCTIPDANLALREVARVLKPGGRFLFLEHGLSPDAGVAKWQHRLDGLQGRIGGGCHLTRDTAALIADSPLQLERLERFYTPGPRTHSYTYMGSARRPG